MKIYLDNLQSIKASEFFRKFAEHINNREKENKLDKTESGIFQTLQENSSSLTFYFGILNRKGIENLILPHHGVEIENNKSPDRPVKLGGDKFSNVIEAYINNYVPNGRFPKGTDKIQGQKSRFFNNLDPVLKADFLCVCNQREYAHPGDHYDGTHGNNKIYICNGFHRFVAYGLWISKNGFKPLEVYYVEWSKL